jgi:cysteine synthase
MSIVEAHQLAVAQAARSSKLPLAALVDRAFVQVRHKQLRIFGAQHQAAPQLLARHGVDQRVERVVNLDQVFKFHIGNS